LILRLCASPIAYGRKPGLPKLHPQNGSPNLFFAPILYTGPAKAKAILAHAESKNWLNQKWLIELVRFSGKYLLLESVPSSGL